MCYFEFCKLFVYIFVLVEFCFVVVVFIKFGDIFDIGVLVFWFVVLWRVYGWDDLICGLFY